jgi:hypothetical protein
MLAFAAQSALAQQNNEQPCGDGTPFVATKTYLDIRLDSLDQ